MVPAAELNDTIQTLLMVQAAMPVLVAPGIIFMQDITSRLIRETALDLAARQRQAPTEDEAVRLNSEAFTIVEGLARSETFLTFVWIALFAIGIFSATAYVAEWIAPARNVVIFQLAAYGLSALGILIFYADLRAAVRRIRDASIRPGGPP